MLYENNFSNAFEKNTSLNEWSILLSYRGSIAHGMYLENISDDKDYISICIPDKDYYLGLKNFGSRGTQEIKEGELDIVAYEFKKAICMLEKGNPNIITLLWNDPQFILKASEEGKHLIRNRHIFANKNIYHSFCGYAKNQMIKMVSGSFQGYMGAKRKELFIKHGYDCKNAAHLIRLLKMSEEFLRLGEFQVLRPDANILLDIKNGLWTIDNIRKEAEGLFKACEEAYNKSRLPEKTNFDDVNKLCMEILEMRFSK